MRIDEPREYILARRIDDFRSRRNLEAFADARDGLVFYINVGAITGINRDDFAVLNK